MATRKAWLASIGPYLYDDTALLNDVDGDLPGETLDAFMTNGQATIGTAPTALNHVVRLQELNAQFPTGSVIIWGGSIASIPTGFLLCDGTVRNIVDFPALGALLGSLWGGDGVTTFAVPGISGRFVPGAGGAYAVAASGGADALNLAHTHGVGTLVNANENAHTHADGTYAAANENAHTHADGTYATGAPSATVAVQSGAGTTVATDTHTHDVTGSSAVGSAHGHDVTGSSAAGSAHTHTISGSTDSQLSATAENRPLYRALAYIIKT